MIGVLQRRVGCKIILIVGMLGALSLASMMLFYTDHMERSLIAQHELHMRKLTDSANRAIESIMLGGYADIAENYAERLRALDDVVDFRIMRTDGLEAFRDNVTIDDVNRRIGSDDFLPRDEVEEVVVMPADTPALIDAVRSAAMRSFREGENEGEAWLTVLLPIANEAECSECHGSESPVRGVVKLTTSLASLYAEVAGARRTAWTVMGIALACFVGLVGVTLWRIVIGPLASVLGALQVLADGDLTARVRGRGGNPDEVGQIGDNVNAMGQSLCRTIRTMTLESQSLFACAKEFVVIKDKLSSASQDTHSVAQNVVKLNQELGAEIAGIRDSVKEAAIDVVSSSVEQLSSSVSTIASSAEQASANVETVSTAAAEMGRITTEVNGSLGEVNQLVSGVARSIEEMDEALNDVRSRCETSRAESRVALESAKEATGVVHDLADSTKEIGRVLNAISSIAEQTKLLALNAAIEAAHAGDAGRGFAIVAHQVKELSTQTVDATKMIAGLIKEIGTGTGRAIDTITKVSEINARIDGIAREIAASVEHQSRSTGEIRSAIDIVNASTRQVMGNAAAMQQKSEHVAGAAATAAEKTDDIARLTAGAAGAAADIARKTQEAGDFILQILKAAERTDSVSGVVQDNLDQAFRLTAVMRALVVSMGDMVDLVDDISAELTHAHTGLDVGAIAFDVGTIKGEYLRRMVMLQKMASEPGAAPPAELSGESLAHDALRLWLAEQAGTSVATDPRFAAIVEGERRAREAMAEALVCAAGGRDETCRERIDAYVAAQRRLFTDLDALYRTAGDPPACPGPGSEEAPGAAPPVTGLAYVG